MSQHKWEMLVRYSVTDAEAEQMLAGESVSIAGESRLADVSLDEPICSTCGVRYVAGRGEPCLSPSDSMGVAADTSSEAVRLLLELRDADLLPECPEDLDGDERCGCIHHEIVRLLGSGHHQGEGDSQER